MAPKEEETEPEGKGHRFNVPSTGEMFDAVKTVVASPIAQGAGLLLCLGLLGFAVWTTTLYVNQLRKTFPLRIGLKEMARLIDYKGKSANERFLEADMFLQELDNITKLNEQLLNEILIVGKKLRQGWKQKFTFLFYFSLHFETWENCLQLCKKMGTSMITIQSHEMEIFLVEELKHRHQEYWIALRRVKSTWMFVDGTKAATEFCIHFQNTYMQMEKREMQQVYHQFDGTRYWKENADRRHGNDCAVLELPCGHHVDCWNARPCNSLRRCICKESAKEKWLK